MIGRINIGIPKQVFGVKLPNEKQVGAGAGAAVETGLQKTTNLGPAKQLMNFCMILDYLSVQSKFLQIL